MYTRNVTRLISVSRVWAILKKYFLNSPRARWISALPSVWSRSNILLAEFSPFPRIPEAHSAVSKFRIPYFNTSDK